MSGRVHATINLFVRGDVKPAIHSLSSGALVLKLDELVTSYSIFLSDVTEETLNSFIKAFEDAKKLL